MTSNFAACLAFTNLAEGGFVNHPRDPGGATNFGITIGTLSTWRGKPASVADVKNLTRTEAHDIYRARYWTAVQGDLLPLGVDLAVFDFGVNSGPATATRALQRSVGVRDDGVLGPVTLVAIQHSDAATVIRSVCAQRLALCKALPTWPTFGRGWSKRILDVRAASLARAKT